MSARLETYRARRDFRRTGEPPPRSATAADRGELCFVIQKHAARRLHYDLRLELDGVLKSWAVPEGPSLVPGEKRLAVEVEDHPLDYASFEGVIPPGEYGAGTVIVWDRGVWRPLGDPHAGLRKGHLAFELAGEKLSGRFDLVRMKPRAREKQPQWLLLKSADAAAGARDILEAEPRSVASGRTIEDVARDAPSRGRVAIPDGARPSALPAFVAPQLATAVDKAPSGPGWIHEIKFDGYRVMARLERKLVKLFTRSGLDWTARFGGLANAFADLAASCALIDGEVVAETGPGGSNFSDLQEDLAAGRDDRLVFWAFDLLHLDGHDLTGLPLAERRAALAALLGEASGKVVKLSPLFTGEGETVRRNACRLGLEGIVSKRLRSRYRSRRTDDWRKTKCGLRQEFIVVGYVPSTTSRRAIGSLALGLRQEGEGLVYAGKVGSGFTGKLSAELHTLLEPLRRATPPVTIPPEADARGVRWVEPGLVAEVAYRERTAGGLVRHAVFRGLRDDKAPEDVIAEDPVSDTPMTGTAGAVRLTHGDRILWPDVGLSKQGLADYHTAVWRWIAPHVADRPLALFRCPEGIEGQGFFQKHAWAGLDRALVHVGHAGDEEIVSISSLDGLLALVQASVIEIHPWGAPLADPERPDRLIFDLDPGEDVPWAAVETAAMGLRERLAAHDLASFVKTTGGKGLHLVVPIVPDRSWDEAKAFTRGIAEAMAKEAPALYTARMARSARPGRIFLDYLRNGRGATAVAAYSPRARPRATVSTPLGWDELGTGLHPDAFTVATLPQRLDALERDPWADVEAARRPLPGPTRTRARRGG